MPDRTSTEIRAPRSLGANRQRVRKLLATLRRDGLVEGLVLIGGYIEYQLEKRFGARVDRKYGSETSGRIRSNGSTSTPTSRTAFSTSP